MTVISKFPLVTISILSAVCSFNAHAVQPRDYIPLPAGASAVQFLHMYGTGNELYSRGDKVSSDFNVNSNISVLLPVHYSTIFGMPAIYEAIIPFGSVRIDGAAVGNESISTSGFADPTFLVGFWPIHDAESKTWLGISGWLTAPLGEYNADHPINLGRNHWAFKTQMGLAKGYGKFVAEVIPSVEVYSRNTDFGPAGETLKRSPLYAVETHFSYDVNPSLLVSLDAFHSRGGETEVRDTTLDRSLNSTSLQLTTRFALAANQFLHLQYLQDVSVKEGPKTNRLSVQFTHAF